MIPKECKRLAEVDFPIAVVSKHSAREKSIRHGHPSTLHLWWARRPLAACRAMLLGLLLPDPCDPHCPSDFKAKAAKALLDVPGWATERMKQQVKSDEGLRKALLAFIGDIADWDVANNPGWIGVARGLVKAAHPEETPLVVDPFAGGGSIPLEALRLGCEAFASDLNPVACLILKVMLEDIPRHGPELAEELRRVGAEIKAKAEKELAEFYPKDPDGAIPIAYLWARTVKCESPNCGAEIPLVRSFWLCKKAHRKQALRYSIVRPKDSPPRVELDVFKPKNEKEVPDGTVTRAKATCLCCGTVLPPARVRAQLAKERGGADVVFDAKGKRAEGARMLAVVTINSGMQGRNYRVPTGYDYQAVWKANKHLKTIIDEWERGGRKGLCPVPDEPIALNEIRRVSVPLYGATTWGDVFTARQKGCLCAYAQFVRELSMSQSSSRICSLTLDRLVILLSAHCRWKSTGESLIDMFGRHAIGMVWDFAESCPGFGDQNTFVTWLEKCAALVDFVAPLKLSPGQIAQADATETYLPDQSSQVWFTDPPYYDSIPYAHLADCFYVWLRRSLVGAARNHSFSELLIPKEGECVVDRPHRLSTSSKDEEYFERKIAQAAAAGRKVLSPSGCASIVFAHKTTEGWEALLSGIIAGGWCITASWPIATELSSRLNARDTASLATSVHLVCRPRPEDAPVGDWGEVLRELPKRVGDWMERLQAEGVRGADLVFACIGPALEIYSRYSMVVDPDEKEIPLGGDPEAKEPPKRGFLAYVWETVGRIALGQVLGTAEARARNGMAEALEEDARLTSLFLWTLQSTNEQNGSGGEPDEEAADESGGDEDEEETAPRSKAKGYSLVFDVVRRFAQPLGIELPKWEGRIIETKKGVVRLMAVSERTKQLFGDEGADAVANLIERDPVKNLQQVLFPEFEEGQAPEIRGRGRGRRKVSLDPSVVEGDAMREATTLDRVHAAMLLQAGGQSNALRALIKAEQERGPDFLRLSNALSALYPKNSEEKRLLDAMLLIVPR